jgi:hypothetical protein
VLTVAEPTVAESTGRVGFLLARIVETLNKFFEQVSSLTS